MEAFALVMFLLQADIAPSLPSFQEYSVADIFKGKPALVDLASHPNARRFRTRLREGATMGPNFAGHFTIVTWGCGTMCEELAIIDSQSGKVHFPLKRALSNGLCFRLESSLLITDPIDQETFEGWKIPDWLKTHYYNWNGSELNEIATTRLVTAPCGNK
jgi:hypothetical protein